MNILLSVELMICINSSLATVEFIEGATIFFAYRSMKVFTPRSWFSQWGYQVWWILVLCLPPLYSAQEQLMVEAIFNQRGIRGTIAFIQESPLSSCTVFVNLTGNVISQSGAFHGM